MPRRILIVLCLAVLATAGAVRPWTDGDTQGRETSVEAAGRAHVVALAGRAKVVREALPVVWLPASFAEDRDAVAVSTLVLVEPGASTPAAPRAARRPARAPPLGVPVTLDTGVSPAVDPRLPS